MDEKSLEIIHLNAMKDNRLPFGSMAARRAL